MSTLSGDYVIIQNIGLHLKVFRIFRTGLEDLFYYLGDYYFKNKEFTKALKFYMHDVSVKPDRFQSWAAMALMRQTRLEEKINEVICLLLILTPHIYSIIFYMIFLNIGAISHILECLNVSYHIPERVSGATKQ